MALHTTPAGLVVEVKEITAADLQSLLSGPLTRAKRGPLSPRQLDVLATLCPYGPTPAEALGSQPKTDRRRSLADSLEREMVDVHSYWTQRANEAVLRPAVAARHDRKRKAVEEFFVALDAVRPYFRTDEHVVWKEDREEAASRLFRVWVEAAALSSIRDPFALSETGPATTFVMSGLRHLGWATDIVPTHSTLLKFLQRSKPDLEQRMKLDKQLEASMS